MKTKQCSRKRGLLALSSLLAAVLMLLAQSESAHAQWTNGTNINNTNTGNVGIGTSSPDSRLSVAGPGTSLPTTYNVGDVATFATPTDGPFNVAIVKGGVTNPQELSFGVNQASHYSEVQAAHSGVTTNNLILNRQGGNVGIGTASPSYTLQVKGSIVAQGATANGDLAVMTANGTTAFWDFSANASNGDLSFYDAISNKLPVKIQKGTPDNTLYLASSGSVGIGTSTPGSQYKLDVAGNMNASGTITGGNIVAKYQDVAEWVESSQHLPAGTVVVLDHTKSNQVVASSQPYDTRVAGVISEQPGIALGESGNNKVLVASTGRVRVKVDAGRAPIHVGDLLVTSEVPGAAMKSRPVNIGGVQLHRPGTLIGKALEPLPKGTREILVLLSLQ